nr:MAG TPA: hypothetical protein [Caudoviricetes sp.]
MDDPHTIVAKRRWAGSRKVVGLVRLMASG